MNSKLNVYVCVLRFYTQLVEQYVLTSELGTANGEERNVSTKKENWCYDSHAMAYD